MPKPDHHEIRSPFEEGEEPTEEQIVAWLKSLSATEWVQLKKALGEELTAEEEEALALEGQMEAVTDVMTGFRTHLEGLLEEARD